MQHDLILQYVSTYLGDQINTFDLNFDLNFSVVKPEEVSDAYFSYLEAWGAL